LATTVGSFLRRSARGSGQRNGRSVSGSTRGQSLAQGMGWFSVGLGTAQLLAPRALSRMIGIDDSDRNAAIMRAIGVRELASGLGIFSQRNDATFLWGRVVGDIMDLALIGAAGASARSDRRKLAGAALAVAGALALDMATARKRSNPEVTELPATSDQDRDEPAEADESPRQIRKAITISRSPDEVQRVWSDVVRHPDIADGLAYSQVSFCPSPRGGETEVRVDVAYEPRLGKVGAAASKLARKDPASRLSQSLRHAKQLIEIGEIVHSDASIHRGPHPARPDREARL